MSAGQSSATEVAPALALAEPVDPAVDLAGFQHLLAQEIRDDWRPAEWDSEAWIFTGVPGHLGTLVNRCRFPGCHGPSFTRRSGLCNVCTGRYSRHTKRMGDMSVEAWINRAVELQGTNWASRVVPILCSVTNCTNRSRGLGVPLMTTTEGNPKRWHQQKTGSLPCVWATSPAIQSRTLMHGSLPKPPHRLRRRTIAQFLGAVSNVTTPTRWASADGTPS